MARCDVSRARMTRARGGGGRQQAGPDGLALLRISALLLTKLEAFSDDIGVILEDAYVDDTDIGVQNTAGPSRRGGFSHVIDSD